MSGRRKGQESGFALLFVMAAAAIIAIVLYAEIPQVAFEAQRNKEADLIAHGEQYKRAIQLFFRRFGRYPASIADLENTNNIRFLRRRYKDPMTGTDEWRLIHVNGGVFTDSLTVKPPAIKGATSAADMASSSAASAGSSTASNSGDASPQAQQRWQVQRGGQPLPGDVAANLDAQGVPVVPPGQPGDGSEPGMAPPGAPQPGDPGYAPGMILPGQPGYQPGMAGSQGYQPGMPPQPGQRPYRPGMAAYGGAANPNQPLYPPVPLPGMATDAGSSNSAPAQTTTGSSQFGPTGSSSSMGTFGSTAGGGAIAGVASTVKALGIKIYKDHTKYNEWEFLYDPRQEILTQGGMQPMQAPTPSLPGAGAPGTTFGGQLPGQQGAPQPGTSSPPQ